MFLDVQTCGDFTFVAVKRNSFKSNTSQKFVISTAVGIIFRIQSDLLAAKYAPRKNFEFLLFDFICEFQPRENLEKTHVRILLLEKRLQIK